MHPPKNKDASLLTFSEIWEEKHSKHNASDSSVVIENNTHGWLLLNFPDENQVHIPIYDTSSTKKFRIFSDSSTDTGLYPTAEEKFESVTESTSHSFKNIVYSSIRNFTTESIGFLQGYMKFEFLRNITIIKIFDKTSSFFFKFSFIYTIITLFLYFTNLPLIFYEIVTIVFLIIHVVFMILYKICFRKDEDIGYKNRGIRYHAASSIIILSFLAFSCIVKWPIIIPI